MLIALAFQGHTRVLSLRVELLLILSVRTYALADPRQGPRGEFSFADSTR
jgi:hypothetical protein